MRRSNPPAPAKRSSGRPEGSGRPCRSVPTATPGLEDMRERTNRPASGPAGSRGLRLGLDERQVAAGRPIEYRNSLGFGVEEHDGAFAAVDGRRGIADGHRSNDLAFGLEDPGHARPGRPPARLAARFHLGYLDRGWRISRPEALAAFELALDLPYLLTQAIHGLRHCGGETLAATVAVQKFLAAGMQRDIGAMSVLLAGDDALRRDRRVVEHPFQLAKLGFDNPADAAGDIDLPSSELESHSRAVRCARVRSTRAG